jgi:adenylate cyclase
MIDAVFEHGGTLVSYRGDGLLAVFGAPIPLDDHADRSLAAAREMLDGGLLGGSGRGRRASRGSRA